MAERTALVTGATGTIGAAVVRRLAAGGYDIAIHHRGSPEAATALAEEVLHSGRRAAVVAAELTEVDLDRVVEGLLDEVAAGLGTPEVVVLNAAAQDLTPWSGLDSAAWDRMYAGVLRHTAVLLHAAAERMVSGGVLVVVGSIEGLRAAPEHSAYAVMKAATHHLVAAAAHELGPRGIRVVGVAPGLVERPGLAREWPQGYHRWVSASALGRTVSATEVAEVVAFLASAGAAAVTGVVLPVDAGWSAAPGW